MKIVESIDLVAAGRFPHSKHWLHAARQVRAAVRATDWPHGSGKFKIRPEKHGNGVLPIKEPCVARLREFGWQTEELPEFEEGALTTGDLDALVATPRGFIGFEWETGNISSSHRAINKLLLALHKGVLRGGFLVVPSSELYRYLTDRVGNIKELRPYFPLWRAIPITIGCLRILVVEHDAKSPSVKRIPKGTDGRARR